MGTPAYPEGLDAYYTLGPEPLSMFYLEKELHLIDWCLPKEANESTLFEVNKWGL